MSDTSRTAEKQESAFEVGDAVTVNGTAMTVIALDDALASVSSPLSPGDQGARVPLRDLLPASEKPEPSRAVAEANAERIEELIVQCVLKGEYRGAHELARAIVEAFPELRADNFARGSARYKDGSLVEPYPGTKP